MLNRLPPPPDTHRFPESNKGAHTKVSAGVSVSLTYPQSAYAELDITGKTPALFVYHCLSNSRDLHQTLEGTEGAANDEDKVEPQLEVPLDCGPALHTLLSGQVLALSSEDYGQQEPERHRPGPGAGRRGHPDCRAFARLKETGSEAIARLKICDS